MSPEDTLIKGGGRYKTIASLNLKPQCLKTIFFSPDSSTNPVTELYYWVTLQFIFWTVGNFEKTMYIAVAIQELKNCYKNEIQASVSGKKQNPKTKQKDF